MSYTTINIDVDVDIDDVWREISDNDLLEEAKKRGHIINKRPSLVATTPDYSHPETLRRHLCDVFEVPYSTKPYDLAQLIANKIEPNYIYQLQEFLCEEYYTMKAELNELKQTK